MVLVDSSVWIEGLRWNGKLEVKLAIQALTEEYEAAWCSIIKLEVLGGSRKEERARLEHYLRVIPYRIVTEATWDLAKDCSWRLRDRDHNVPTSDILIAAVAIEGGIRVYSIDQHFFTMQDVLGLRLYRPGYGGLFAAEE
jgi:predicted nucleic acid-binding protein